MGEDFNLRGIQFPNLYQFEIFAKVDRSTNFYG